MPEPSDIEIPTCIACKETIPIGATICSKCKSYQTRWKNYLQYAASVVGIFTVVSALSVYIISKAPDLKKVLFWSDNIQTMSFTYPGNLTILNTGDGKILISHITYRVEEGSSGTLRVDKVLDVGQILNHQVEPEEQRRIQNYTVIPHSDSKDWGQKVSRSKPPSDSDACIIHTVIYEQDPIYLQFKNSYRERFQTIAATASIHFLSLQKREALQQSLPVRSILLRNPDDKCPK